MNSVSFTKEKIYTNNCGSKQNINLKELKIYWTHNTDSSDCPRSISLMHGKIMCYKLLKKTLLLTFCVVDMLIIVTELDKLLKIGPLQLSVAVSGSYVKIWLTLQLADVLDSPHLKVISWATLDNTTSMSHAGRKKRLKLLSAERRGREIFCAAAAPTLT